MDGRRPGFEEFFARTSRRAFGLAFVLSGRVELAEELTQEAFAAAFKRWDEVAEMVDPEAWVRRVVANKAASQVRRKLAEARAYSRHGPTARDALDHPAVDHEWVWALVRQLPKRQAQAVALRYYAGLTMAEIGEVLGCSPDTVNTHLRRARQTLVRRVDRKDMQ